MFRRGRWILACLLIFACPLPAKTADMTKLTIATGVDPGFSVFYVAKLGGFFEKNGLDVDLRTGPAGGLMVPLLISGATNAVLAASFAGVVNHLKDPDIVAVAQVVRYDRWYGMVAKNDIKSVADLKGKKIGISFGNASESYFYDVLKHYNLNPDDFKAGMVNVEPPEMVAAIERGDVQAFSSWEPWLSRTTLGVANTHVLVDSLGKVQDVGFVYMSRKWIDANHATAITFLKALQQANDFIAKNPDQTKQMVGKFLNIPANQMDSMMPKIGLTFVLGPDSYEAVKTDVDQLVTRGKLKPGEFDYASWFYPGLLKTITPSAVTLPSKMASALR